MDAADIDLPAVAIQEGRKHQSRGGEQSLDVVPGEENVAGGMAAAIGAANAGETQASGVKRLFSTLDAPLGMPPVSGSLE